MVDLLKETKRRTERRNRLRHERAHALWFARWMVLLMILCFIGAMGCFTVAGLSAPEGTMNRSAAFGIAGLEAVLWWRWCGCCAGRMG
jgi:hypothetical protein